MDSRKQENLNTSAINKNTIAVYFAAIISIILAIFGVISTVGFVKIITIVLILATVVITYLLDKDFITFFFIKKIRMKKNDTKNERTVIVVFSEENSEATTEINSYLKKHNIKCISFRTDKTGTEFDEHNVDVDRAHACIIVGTNNLFNDEELHGRLFPWLHDNNEKSAILVVDDNTVKLVKKDARFRDLNHRRVKSLTDGEEIAHVSVSSLLKRATERGFLWRKKALETRIRLIILIFVFVTLITMFIASVMYIRGNILFGEDSPMSRKHLGYYLAKDDSKENNHAKILEILDAANRRLQKMQNVTGDFWALYKGRGPSLWVISKSEKNTCSCQSVVLNSKNNREHCLLYEENGKFASNQEMGVVGCAIKTGKTALWTGKKIVSTDKNAEESCAYGSLKDNKSKFAIMCTPVYRKNTIGDKEYLISAAICLSAKSASFLRHREVRYTLEEYAGFLSLVNFEHEIRNVENQLTRERKCPQ